MCPGWTEIHYIDQVGLSLIEIWLSNAVVNGAYHHAQPACLLEQIMQAGGTGSVSCLVTSSSVAVWFNKGFSCVVFPCLLSLLTDCDGISQRQERGSKQRIAAEVRHEPAYASVDRWWFLGAMGL